MSATIIRGDARHLPLSDESVDLVVTSPPYWNQRDYRDAGESLSGQIGAEATPEEYLAALLDCTCEWARVLKPGGSIFVNLSDTYRDKSLLLIPERYRIAVADKVGMLTRAVVIWSKNGQPESVTDRVRRAHEDWVHLTKGPRYFSAIDEIREPHVAPQRVAGANAFGARNANHRRTATGAYSGPNPLGALPGSVWEVGVQPLKVPATVAHARCCGGLDEDCENGIRHDAPFPLEWPRRIILGWSPAGICTACGEGRRPAVASVGLDMSRPQSRRAHALAERAGLTEAHLAALLSVGVSDTGRGAATQTGTGKNRPEIYVLADEARRVLGGYAREYLLRRPTGLTYVCGCPDITASTRPSVVLDPFGGSGSAALVADVLGRHGVSVDRSADYCHLARWRTTDPGERARVLGKPKPPKPMDGQGDLFEVAS